MSFSLETFQLGVVKDRAGLADIHAFYLAMAALA
jgi:hypothetical protein